MVYVIKHNEVGAYHGQYLRTFSGGMATWTMDLRLAKRYETRERVKEETKHWYLAYKMVKIKPCSP